MDQLLPDDFKEFLRLLSANRVSYLLVGGYAVGHYGYSRTTGDMDIWIEISPTNAKRIVRALKEFGFRVPELRESLFLSKKSIVRMGVPPLRLEILMDISGVTFSDCYRRRKVVIAIAGVRWCVYKTVRPN